MKRIEITLNPAQLSAAQPSLAHHISSQRHHRRKDKRKEILKFFIYLACGGITSKFQNKKILITIKKIFHYTQRKIILFLHFVFLFSAFLPCEWCFRSAFSDEGKFSGNSGAYESENNHMKRTKGERKMKRKFKKMRWEWNHKYLIVISILCTREQR